ncbi:alkaline phosphatase [Cyclobacterium sp.]|uniref:alkaline phosphatase n=1 Tax=Cyclobacterium sp. TaxID=1966343 RepID=UPI0019B2487E|nr:alkaline phosphatase [Cyclobacterium sp.]MBD3628364.1 alkaline phosphatase [Cyclobacterium sp.]
MKRREFFNKGLLASMGLGALGTQLGYAKPNVHSKAKTAKNIIFLVSDGMSTGTLNMADLLLRQKEGKWSRWMGYYQSSFAKRSLMDTASSNSMVTDSAAAGSSWGGGMRVPNGSLNVGPNGELPVPILQKFKSAGKSVGCVTSVPITHATPASFCVNEKSRSAMPEIAVKYLDLEFDVMMGGGKALFDSEYREDKRDLLGDFRKAGFSLAQNREEMRNLNGQSPVLGLFSEGGMPYAIDRENDPELKKSTPSLAEMSAKAIDLLSQNPNGFAMQIEGGKVDWAAHANDAPALLYDQLDFDAAVGIALDFASRDGETLVIMTTDHGNANPGLFSSNKFSKLYTATRSNEWILKQLSGDNTPAQVADLIEAYQGLQLKTEEAEAIVKKYQGPDGDGMYGSGEVPNHLLASIQANHTGIGWSGTGHSSDYVELAMYGPGSENLPAFIENYKLHNLMLEAAQVPSLSYAI